MSKHSIGVLVSALLTFFFGGNLEEVQPEQRPARQETALSTSISVESRLDTPRNENPNNRVVDPTRAPYVSPLWDLNPSNVEIKFELTEDGSGYYIYENIGGVWLRRPSYISFEDYLEYRQKKGINAYYKEQGLQQSERLRPGLIPDINIPELQDLFGGGPIEIRPTGFANISLSYDVNNSQNPALPTRNQKQGFINFDQQIQLGTTGQIGNLMDLNFNFDTKATFDFENLIRLKYDGKEDAILQGVEAGNVSMPLGNTLIQGRQNLFGLKLRWQLGPVMITTVGSVEQGQVESVRFGGGSGSGGGVETPFAKEVAQYDEYRHYFMGHYFRSRYEPALENLPVINSTVRINRVEVWINNVRSATTQNNRNAVGFIDLGENELTAQRGGSGVILNDQLINSDPNIRLPDNNANNLYSILTSSPDYREYRNAPRALKNAGFQNGIDFEVVTNMRKLEANEYRFDPQLGYISLNQKVIPNQVLFVAFEYTLNGEIFKVGEFSQDVPTNPDGTNALFLKMLKPASVKPTYQAANATVEQYPAWDLMMKNIYNIGYGLSPNGFFLDILYNSGTSAGKLNFLPDGPIAQKPLIQATGADKLTNHTAPGPDFYFDYIEGRTVVADRGMIIFTQVEPFGDALREQLRNDQTAIRKYVFDPLYDGTQQDAIQLFPQLNRYTLEGYYRGSNGAEIPLNTFNLAEGSVRVTAGGRQLTEGQDFIVDYYGAKVTITNPAVLASGDIQVDYETNSLYNVQTKTLVGARAEYSPADNLNLGATALRLTQRPPTQKTILGDEPVRNTVWGLDAAWRTESYLLTKIIDKLPNITATNPSPINIVAEVAQFIPGQPRQLATARDESNVYLDDFEAAETEFSMDGGRRWSLASFPQHVEPSILYDPFVSSDERSVGFSRAKLSWYSPDPTLLSAFRNPRFNMPIEDALNNYTRQVLRTEIEPQATVAAGTNFVSTLDLVYTPEIRGPYNYNTEVDPVSGYLLNPQRNWAGIMRQMDVNNDFEATNVEFLEFWMMDPYMDEPNHEGGKFIINLGQVSEDVLQDNVIAMENGLAATDAQLGNMDTTIWGRVPLAIPPNQNFSNDEVERRRQDVGLDGMNNEDERRFYGGDFSNFLQQMEATLGVNSQPYQELLADPSSDDFVHFNNLLYRDAGAGIIERYSKFNGLEGNSPSGEEARNELGVLLGSNMPDNEDANANGGLATSESYYEYQIDLTPGRLDRGQNYVVDIRDTTVVLPDNSTTRVRWYQFRVPLSQGVARGGITNLKSVDFMRLYMTDFDDSVIVRLADFNLVATQWRRFVNTNQLDNPCGVIGPDETTFNIGSVSLEENSTKQPFPYVLPPGIRRQNQNQGTAANLFSDERSLLMKAEDLKPGDARGVFRNLTMDLRNYERLKLWVHAEAIGDPFQANFDHSTDATVFMRIGLDNSENYYEYEMPLTPSSMDVSFPSSEANIWPDANEFNILLTQLPQAKARRNLNGANPTDRFTYTDDLPPGHKIHVIGAPTTSNVRVIMVGVRNPRDCNSNEDIDLEVWINELRVTDFDQRPGWAANAQASIDLADFGNVQGSFSTRTPGFGGLDQRVSERNQELRTNYDLAANFSLGKLFPQKWNVNLPVFMTFGEQKINPRFDPREPDVLTNELLGRIEDRNQRDSTRKVVQEYSRNRSISFNNVRFGGGGGGFGKGGFGGGGGGGGGGKRPAPWNPGNFDFSFSYAEQLNRSAFLENLRRTQHQFVINYRYNFPKLELKPFSKWNRKNPLSDFNLNLLPNSFSFNLVGDRQFEERKLRPAAGFGGNTNPIFAKNFMLTRTYNLSWQLSQGLSINFSAVNNARVDEVRGYYADADSIEIDSVGTFWENFFKIGRDTPRGHDNFINFGRTTNYTHNLVVSYRLPLSKYRWTDYINGTVNYSANFRWDQAPENNPSIGATIGNSQVIQANGGVDLSKLYKKITPLQKVIDNLEKRQRAKEQYLRQKQLAKEREKKGQPATYPEPPVDTVRLKFLRNVGSELLRIALSVRNVNVTWNRNAATILPGYIPKMDNLGLDFRYYDPFDTTVQRTGMGNLPPTLGFISGSQKDIRRQAAENGWISKDTTLANFFSQNKIDRINLRTSVELFKGFRIDLNANRDLTENYSELFRWDPAVGDYVSSDRLLNGRFSMSYIFLGTMFEKGSFSNQTTTSEFFQEFEQNRAIISERLGQRNAKNIDNFGNLSLEPFQNGYDSAHQDVLIPAFLSAYSITRPEKVSLSAFPRIPLPNWSINYNLLNSFPGLKSAVTSLTVRHMYRGTFGVDAFTNNLEANVDGSGLVTNLDTSSNFFPVNNIERITISEQFSPLLGVTANFKNGMTGTLEYRTDRRMMFSTGTLQMTESRSKDISFTFGYRKDKLDWHLRLFGKNIDLDNSLNAQMRFTLSDRVTRNRNLDSNTGGEPTQGSLNAVIEPAIDYVVNTQLNVRIFWQKNITNPKTTQSFPTTFTSGGVQLRFTLGN